MQENKKLVQSLQRIYDYKPAQVDAFLKRLSPLVLSKNDYLLSAGRRCNFMAFVSTGSVRFYTLSESEDLTLHFFTENSWVADFESIVAQQPSKNYLQAIEPTKVELISLDSLHDLMDRYAEFRYLLSLMKEWIIPTAHLRSISASSPDDRYKLLLTTHPEWINRFPQMHIASYLGMTKETLSRVKSRVK